MSKTTKQCTKCVTIKNISEFRKCKETKDGLRWSCKSCAKETDILYQKTKDGFITQVYGGQRTSSKKRGHRPPEYSKQDLKDWLFSQELFHKIFSEWEQSGYSRRLKPSIDRKCDDVHYCFSNIQLMTWGGNQDKANEDKRLGLFKSSKPVKIVKQYTKNGEYVGEYFSMHEAARQIGVKYNNISMCCNGRRKTAGGYKWSFK